MNNSFQLLINIFYAIVFCAVGLLIYLSFGDSFARDWDKSKPISEERQKEALLRYKIANAEIDYDKVINGVHVYSGLAYDENFSIVRSICTSCHSAKLITQNRATRQGWKDMITWMQETQGLQDLGSNEMVVLDYLEKYYAPDEQGRRKQLEVADSDWYEL